MKRHKNVNKKTIRLTESDLHKVIKEAVNIILKEDYYSAKRPYGSRKLSDFSSDEAKALNDYDSGFGVWQRHKFDGSKDTFEPAPLINDPYNEPMFPENEQPYQYWDSLRNFDDRHPIDPSSKDKEYQINKSWMDDSFGKNWNYYDYANDEGEDDYNYNVHDNAFDAAGAKGRVGRLNSFDDDSKGEMSRKFNGTLSSLNR